MRILHTSDWHLGRTLCGVNLHEAQEAALDAICRLVETPRDGIPIDAVLLAGDVYDRAVPPVESVRLFERTLARLAERTTVVVTSGNHDSAVRLGFGSALFRDRIRLVTSLESIGVPVLVTDGAGLTAAIHAIPWLDVDQARFALAGGAGKQVEADGPVQPLARSHEAVMSAAMDLVRDEVSSAPPAWRHLVVAHAFVVGGAASDSERSITVGGVDHLPAGVFHGVSYVALGHLHGSQACSAPDGVQVRYSGSPLRYSFSEQDQDKGVLLVDVPADGPVVVTRVAIDQPRAMATLTGTLDELLTDASLVDHEGSWCRVVVTDRARPERLFDRVRSRFPHALQTAHEPPAAIARSHRDARLAGAGEALDPRQLGREFIEYVSRAAASDAEVEVVAAAFERARRATDADLLAELRLADPTESDQATDDQGDHGDRGDHDELDHRRKRGA